MPKTISRGAGYTRLSDPTKQEKGYSKQFQERKIRDYCAERDIVIRDEHLYYDGERSTYWRERRELQNMLAAGRRREFDVLILYDLDRLSREPMHQSAILEELQYLGIKIIVLNADQNHVNDGTLEGEILTSIHGIVSKQEHRKRIKRSNDGVVERTVQNGNIMPSYKPLYGYRWDDPGHKKKEKYVIYEPEAQIARKVFNWKLHGITIQQICIRLNSEGVPTPKGGSVWKPQVILDMLRHPFYKGKAYAHRYQHIHTPGKGMKQVLRPECEWVALPDGTVPAIVSESEWNQVQRQLQWNKEQAARRNRYPEAALCRAGIAKCGLCGANMAYKRRYNAATHGGADMYCCMKQNQLGNVCRNSVISVRIIDEAVWQKCLDLLANPQVVEEALRLQYLADPNKPSRESLERAVLTRGRKMQTLMEELEDEGDKEVKKLIRLRIKSLAEEKAGLEEELDIARRATVQWEAAIRAIAEFEQWCQTIHARIAKGEEICYQEKRNAVDRLGIKVRCFKYGEPTRFTITCHPPEIMERLSKHSHDYSDIIERPLLVFQP